MSDFTPANVRASITGVKFDPHYPGVDCGCETHDHLAALNTGALDEILTGAREYALGEITACAETVARERAAGTLRLAAVDLLTSAVHMARAAGLPEDAIEAALRA